MQLKILSNDRNIYILNTYKFIKRFWKSIHLKVIQIKVTFAPSTHMWNNIIYKYLTLNIEYKDILNDLVKYFHHLLI